MKENDVANLEQTALKYQAYTCVILLKMGNSLQGKKFED
jgi:hypothetical protein